MASFLQSVMKSGGARAITLPVTAASSLLSSMIIIATAGVSGYAAISVISTLFLLIQFSDLGLGSSVINEVASSSASEHSKLSVIASSFRILCIVSLALMLIAVGGVSVFSWSGVLGIQSSSLDDLDSATLLAISIFAISVPLGLSQRILVGLGRNHLAIYLSLFTSVTSVLVVYLVSKSELPAAYMSVSQSSGVLITNLISTFVVLKFIPFRFRMIVDRKRFRGHGILGTGLWMLLLSIMLAFSFQAGRIILSHRSSELEVGDYSLAMQFYMPVVSIVSASGFALWPIFAKNRTFGVDARRSFLRILAAFSAGGFVLATVFALLANPVGLLISGGRISLGLDVIVLCAILIILQSIQIVPGMLLTQSAGLRFQSLCGVVAAMISVSMSYVLSPSMGAAAPVLAACCAVAVAQVGPSLYKALSGV